MILVIDNYDSFVYNLVQYLGEILLSKKKEPEIQVFRNDKITIEEIRRRRPQHIIISPGPCTPKEAGISNQIIKNLGPEIPILGVCLGHQCIGSVYGGLVVRADRLMHGKTSMIYHNKRGVFKGIEDPFEATRYHSLILQPESLPDVLTITAWTQEEEIMGIRHREFPVVGVQFHPESILTQVGMVLLENFLDGHL